MGWYVMGKGTIEFPKGVSTSFTKRIETTMKNIDDFGEVDLVDYSDHQEIYFDMGGNKGIDYAELEKIQETLESDPNLIGKKGVGLRISVNEFTESDGGYYFEKEN